MVGVSYKPRMLTPVLIATGAAIALGLPLVLKAPFSLHVLIMFCVYGVLGEAWNILGGYAGQISLGHTVFFGIGAYTSTVLLLTRGVSPWIGMVVGIVVSIVASLAIGSLCFRLNGKYFVIATIAVLQIVQTLVTCAQSLGGASGLSVPVRNESLASFQFNSSKVPYAYIAILMLAVAVFVVARLDRSRSGYYFRVIRESKEVAESLGINTVVYKLYAIVLSAVLASAAGTFYAQYVLFIDPNSAFSYPMAIKMCLLVVLGGVGTVWGPVVGALILIPLSEISRAYIGGGGQGIDLIIYGLLMTLIVIYRPDGIAGLIMRGRPKTGGERRATLGHGSTSSGSN